MQEVLPRLWPVFDARYQSDSRIHRDDRRAAVAEKRKRYADNRGDADAHADVDEGLERERCRNAEADEHAEWTARAQTDDAAAYDDYAQKHDYRDAGDHAELLADRGEDAVGVPRIIAALREASFAEADAGPAAGGQRVLAVVCLPGYALTGRVNNVRYIRREDSLFLIILEQEVPEQRHHRRDRRRCRRHPVPRDTGADEHDDENGQEYERTAEIVRNNGYETEVKRPMQSELDDRREFVERSLLFIVFPVLIWLSIILLFLVEVLYSLVVPLTLM